MRDRLCVYNNEELKLTTYTYKHWGRDTHTHTVGGGGEAWPRGSSHSLLSPAHSGEETRREEK